MVLKWWPRGEELLISLPGSRAALLPISLIYRQRIQSSSIAWGISEIYFGLIGMLLCSTGMFNLGQEE